jgi:alkylated DNA repair dioxygenase AlkB
MDVVLQSLRGGQADLFDEPLSPCLPRGLRSEDGFLCEQEERALIAHIGGVQLSPFRFQQWTGHRLTHSYGWSYDFQNGAFARAEPVPSWLMTVKERAAGFAGLDPADLVQALVIRYDPGAGIGWHKDRPVFEHVVGISLGVPAVLRFRQRTQAGFSRLLVPLAPRSIYHLSSEARHGWEHSIVARDTRRWSITFRSLSESGKKLAQ